MTMRISIHTAVLLLLFSATSVSLAQSPQEIIKTELLTLSLNGIVPGYYYRNGKEVMKLTASTDGISPPIYYVGPGVLGLYKDKADLEPPPAGKEPPKPLLTVAISKDSDRTLLVFAYTNRDTELPKLKSYAISDQSLKAGDYRIFNTSNIEIYAVFDDKKVVVPAAKEGIVSASGWGNNIKDLNVKFGMKVGDEIKSVYSSVWGHRPERRSFIFVFQGSDKYRPLTIKKFYDLPAFKARKPSAETENAVEPAGAP